MLKWLLLSHLNFFLVSELCEGFDDWNMEDDLGGVSYADDEEPWIHEVHYWGGLCCINASLPRALFPWFGSLVHQKIAAHRSLHNPSTQQSRGRAHLCKARRALSAPSLAQEEYSAAYLNAPATGGGAA